MDCNRNMDLNQCGKNLKKAREKKGWNQENFALQLGQKPGYSAAVSYWETGKEPVPKEHRAQVAEKLGIPESEFLPTIGYVYLFYYPDAESAKNQIYPCKIGSTSQSVRHRVKSIINQWGYDEMPEMPLCIPVPIDKEAVWEDIIHGVLKLNNRWINKQKAERLCLKGEEWFYTSPDEVKSLYEKLQTQMRHLLANG